MRYDDSVTTPTTARPAANGRTAKSKRMCSYRLQSSNTRRTHSPYTLLPHAQHRNDDVQRTYKLQQRRIHHQLEASRPNRIKSNSAREAAIQASMYVSTVIKVESGSNSIQPAGQHHARRYHGVRHVPCAVRCSDWHSKDVGCRQSRLYNNEITQMPVPVPNVQP